MDERATHGVPGAGLSKTVAYTGTAGTTAAFTDAPDAVRVVSTTDCFIEIGSAPTAVANTGMYLPAYVPEYFKTKKTSSVKVSAIQVSAAGSIYVTPIY